MSRSMEEIEQRFKDQYRIGKDGFINFEQALNDIYGLLSRIRGLEWGLFEALTRLEFYDPDWCRMDKLQKLLEDK